MQSQHDAQVQREIVEAGSAQINKEKELVRWWLTFIGSRTKYHSHHLKKVFPQTGSHQVAEASPHMWSVLVQNSGGGCPRLTRVACYRSGKKIFEFSLDPEYCNGPSFVQLELQDVGFVSDGLQLFINGMVEKVSQLRDDFQPFIDAAQRSSRGQPIFVPD